MTSTGGRRRAGARLAASAALAALAVAAALVPGASGRMQVLAAPKGLEAFQLRLGDASATAPTFSRTPSFGWAPVRGAIRYQIELSTSKSFSTGSNVVWSARTATSPVAGVPIALPWIARAPASYYWRVRALGLGNAASGWSQATGFTVQPPSVPHRLGGGTGWVRWSTVDGATGYDVWFVNLKKTVSTIVPAADLRDYYGSSAPSSAQWRVRAVRKLYGSDKRALPVASYGAWSPTYTTPVATSATAGLAAVPLGPGQRVPTASGVMPMFVFPTADKSALHHVYVTADSACRQVVLNGAVVSGNAFAFRSVQYRPGSRTPASTNSGTVYGTDGKPVKPSESGASRGALSASGAGAPTGPATPSAAEAGLDASAWAKVALPPGRYYWTVVPVQRRADGSFHDLRKPSGACALSKGSFTIDPTRPGLGTAAAPFATGLSTSGRLASATAWPARFYAFPMVAWTPQPGATRYLLEWSRSATRWKPAGQISTFSTSAVLPLTPGRWWYRVRGASDSISGVPALPWTGAVRMDVASPTFAVVG